MTAVHEMSVRALIAELARVETLLRDTPTLVLAPHGGSPVNPDVHALRSREQVLVAALRARGRAARRAGAR